MVNKNSFAKTPPMGWNSYDYYDTTVDEEAVKANADFMAAHMKEFGYEYIVVDIEWYAKGAGSRRQEYQYIPFDDLEMDAYGRLQPDPKRFPSSVGGKGFGPLSEYIHSLGLKFGIHIMRGIPRKAAHDHLPVFGTDTVASEVADAMSICGWNPDMYGVKNTEAGQAYYDSLVAMYAEWGVDFIKCDDICDSWLNRTDSFSGWNETGMLHKAIMKSGREIVLSLSPGPAHVDKAWFYSENANMWRITDDFWDNFKLLKEMFRRCEMWQDHVKEGCFPDCDMIPLGYLMKGFGNERTTNFTYDEAKTMMTLWCMFRSPIMVGAELTKLDEQTLGLLTNRELLSLLDSDRVGRQLFRNDEQAAWVSYSVKGGPCYVALFNLSDDGKVLSADYGEYSSGKALTEVWDGFRMQTSSSEIEVSVPAHGVKIYRIDE